jgi:enamine deaminase RidA (YjgF/YER057c/UK114 family)
MLKMEDGREWQARLKSSSLLGLLYNQLLRIFAEQKRDFMLSIKERLAARGIQLPTAPAPVAAYVATQRAGNLLFVSGQLPRHADKLLHEGLVGRDVSLEQAIAAARLCGINILAQVEAACGLDSVKQCVKLTGFVACVPDFTKQPLVINGASELMLEVFEDAGRHSRSAVGVVALPSNAPVEVEAIFAIAA